MLGLSSFPARHEVYMGKQLKSSFLSGTELVPSMTKSQTSERPLKFTLKKIRKSLKTLKKMMIRWIIVVLTIFFNQSNKLAIQNMYYIFVLHLSSPLYENENLLARKLSHARRGIYLMRKKMLFQCWQFFIESQWHDT